MGTVTIADSLRDARIALRSAWYDAALDLLNVCEDWPSDEGEVAMVMKAEALGRRDPVGAVAYLASVSDLPASTAGRFNFAIEFGKAHSGVRDFSSAQSRYEGARGLADAVLHCHHTMAYHDLRIRWLPPQCGVLAPL